MTEDIRISERNLARDAASFAATEIATVVGAETTRRASDAKRVISAIKRTHTRQVGRAASPDAAVKVVAKKVRDGAVQAASESRTAGGMQQLKGHFIEILDNDTYNAKSVLRGKKLVPRPLSNAPAYDADRYIKGKFAGAVQQKSSAAGVEKAISAMDKAKPGSAAKGVLRVPKDQVEEASRRAGNRLKEVKGMDFTLGQASDRLQRGVTDVASGGTRAASQAIALGKAGAVGAVTGAALGTIGDAAKLVRGELSRRDFVENRAMDAAESGTGAVISTVASGLATAGTVALVGAEAAGAVAALPVIVGGATAAATGYGVTKGFIRVRTVVEERQANRRKLDLVPAPEQLIEAGAEELLALIELPVSDPETLDAGRLS